MLHCAFAICFGNFYFYSLQLISSVAATSSSSISAAASASSYCTFCFLCSNHTQCAREEEREREERGGGEGIFLQVTFPLVSGCSYSCCCYCGSSSFGRQLSPSYRSTRRLSPIPTCLAPSSCCCCCCSFLQPLPFPIRIRIRFCSHSLAAAFSRLVRLTCSLCCYL